MPNRSQGETRFENVRTGLAHSSNMAHASLPTLASLSHLGQVFPALSIWTKAFFETFIHSFFLISLTIDLIKLVWQAMALFYANNVNLEKSGEFVFNLIKASLVCLILLGTAILTATTALAVMTILLGIDPLLNLAKSVYFSYKMFRAKDSKEETFFGEKAKESAKFSMISGTFAIGVMTFVILPITVPVAISITVASIAGLAIGVPTLIELGKLFYAGYQKISKKISRYMGWSEAQPKPQISTKLARVENNFVSHQQSDLAKNVVINDNLAIKPTRNVIQRLWDFNYYQHAIPLANNNLNSLQLEINNHLTALKEINFNNKKKFLNPQQRKRSDKINALIALQDILTQWTNVFAKDGGELTFNTIKPTKKDKNQTQNHTISGIKKRDELSSDQEFDKQNTRVLKLIQRKLLENYPSAFQSLQYKGKVEFLFEQAFTYMKENARSDDIAINLDNNSSTDSGPLSDEESWMTIHSNNITL